MIFGILIGGVVGWLLTGSIFGIFFFALLGWYLAR